MDEDPRRRRSRRWAGAALVAAVAVGGTILTLAQDRSAATGPPQGTAASRAMVAHKLLHQDNIVIRPLEPAAGIITGAEALRTSQRSLGFLADDSAEVWLATFTDPNVGHEVRGKVPDPTWVDVPVYVVYFEQVEVPVLGLTGGTALQPAVDFVDARTGESLEFLTL